MLGVISARAFMIEQEVKDHAIERNRLIGVLATIEDLGPPSSVDPHKRLVSFDGTPVVLLHPSKEGWMPEALRWEIKDAEMWGHEEMAKSIERKLEKIAACCDQ